MNNGHGERRRGRTRRIAYVMGAYFLICTLALIWPVAGLANRIEPVVFGMPFFFFWHVLWVFMVFVGCLVTYLWEYAGEDE
ncbi:DUF3311 domain-containing protein [Rubrobacter taiwanensis]|jgi:hypothetical protein|uniref:DUF3311 domain-containing protein n=2 Tax=Rubrobacter taiwanensis TaxID=185139 RepID=A0A4R1BNN4_9ACTN|nr:DUF3311 domain-containing protein [Rubrobacter taiwanensis]